eukprot:CAMPEP_0184984206 /NCGR_PEP_ID=MMETSP1098-20130426/13219_1 /TAXON_ID=89044 /ORGANISM="Spumella elongata, Strain CCAP 955/1" /LENGTH=474 /DNA_ID=CAMNT_0027508151 /DNA_START=335 /DNA_END=1756 /DNA_ORIENTATION=+
MVVQSFERSPTIVQLTAITPPIIKEIVKAVHPWELAFLLLFQFSYSKILEASHKIQTLLWRIAKKKEPNEWKSSILGFVHERSKILVKLIAFNYCAKLGCTALTRLGFDIRPDFPDLLSRISYALFLAQFADLFKSRFLRSFFPQVGESKRQSYMVDKSASVVVWTVGGLVACEMLSSFLKIPLSSTLAFGGVGGLAMGLSLRDIAANFMGGLMLLVNEPFTPGDMVTFKNEKLEFTGRVERVGWGQTRIRGTDTRPTYVPNAQFAQAAVTNNERITHRKFETIVPLRFQDYKVLPAVIERIKERLRTLPKLDVLSMPFRISFVRVGSYSLDVEIVCYFATKSIDEFLTLQQGANVEVISAIHECGAALALPTTTVLPTIGIQIGTSSPNTEHPFVKSSTADSNINPYRVDSYIEGGIGVGDGAAVPGKSSKSILKSAETVTEKEDIGADHSAPTADNDLALAEAMELAEALMD